MCGHMWTFRETTKHTTNMTNITPLEVLSYLTDPVFGSVVILLVAGLIMLHTIDKIGRLP